MMSEPRTDHDLLPPTDLRCEYLADPLGIDVAQPRLSWRLDDDRRGAGQTAYQLQAASTAQALAAGDDLLWDTGRISSDQTTHISWAGPALTSNMTIHWQVRIWDADGQPGPWSQPALFTTGLMQPGDWRGQWIGQQRTGEQVHELPATYLRRRFDLPEKPIRHAHIHITARGIYRLHCNGQLACPDYFQPGWTEYPKRLPYRTYDLTDLLRDGDNTLGVVLGDGWYRGHLMWRKGQHCYGDQTRLLAQLHITFTDGSEQVITTDEKWRTAHGPVQQGDFYMGETYDARLEEDGWETPSFDDSHWQPVVVEARDALPITAHRAQPVRVIQQITPRKITQPTPGTYIFDLGQNIVGFARLKVSGPAGHAVTLRFTEMLQKDGTLYTQALRGARSTDTYILRGRPEGEIWEPAFTFHGFRYIEITNWPEDTTPPLDAVIGVVLHTDAPLTSEFETAHPLLNQLQSNIIWGQRGNYLEVPTDCPQRNERLGWTGDAQVFIATGCFNMDAAAFFTKWQIDLTDSQDEEGAFPAVAPDILDKPSRGRAGWADAGIICPWWVHLYYGDTRILDENYDAMARWIEFQLKTSRHLIRPDFGYGDWLNLSDPTSHELVGTAYFAHTTDLMSTIAQRLGRTEDALRFAQLAQDIRHAYQHEFITPAGRVMGDSQTAYLLTLAFNLAPASLEDNLALRLVERLNARKDHLATGFLGTPLLLPVLTRIGRLDLAYKLLLNEDYPSWLYPIHQGATTMWERWNAYTHEHGFGDASMNSFNHYAYGCVGAWMYQTLGGIRIDEDQPGFKHFILHPQPGGGITHARAAYQAIHGRIQSQWRIDGHSFHYGITIPPNTTATVHLPTSHPEEVTESDQPLASVAHLRNIRVEDDHVALEAQAGSYRFVVKRIR